MRAVLDPNVLVSALLSPGGAPAQIVSRWLGGEFELIASERLLVELEATLAYPKLHGRIPAADAAAFVALLRHGAVLASDSESTDATPRSRDPGDDNLLALAEAERAVLVSGDRHVLELAERFPIRTAREFLGELESGL